MSIKPAKRYYLIDTKKFYPSLYIGTETEDRFDFNPMHFPRSWMVHIIRLEKAGQAYIRRGNSEQVTFREFLDRLHDLECDYWVGSPHQDEFSL